MLLISKYNSFPLAGSTSSRYQSSRSPSGVISRFSLSTVDRRRFLQFPAGASKFLSDELFIWKDSLILSGEHLVGEIVECVVGLCCSLFGAQNEPGWRVLAGPHLVLASVVQVQVHLSSVRVTEFSDLEIFCGAGRYVALERWPIELRGYFDVRRHPQEERSSP